MPLIRLPFRGRANLRNHRKTVVIDGQCALVGGMNLAEEYLGPEPDPKRWRDLVVQVCGPAVRDLDDLFRSDWRFATNEDLEPRPRAEIPAESELDGLMTAQTVASGPDVVGDPFYESLVSALFAARQRVWVVTPYFIPDETLVRALDLAARRGVDVRLVVPLRSNHLIADLARGSYLHEVHDSGGSILKFRPGMVHAKAILIDDGLSIIGTANMDMRSLFLNYEVSLFFYSRPLAEQTAAWMTALMTGCRPYRVPRGRVIILMHDVFRLLSPLL
jgi:cardiolipin synthase